MAAQTEARGYGPRYYAANILDPNGYSLEISFKAWLYDGSDDVQP